MSETAIVHVIDDDPGVRFALSTLLRSVGYSTNLYGSADEFIETQRTRCPGCLLVDVRLPGTSGLELQQYLAGFNNPLPVILMTGFGDIPMSVKSMKAGAIDFLTKPFRDQDLLEAIAVAIESDRKQSLTAHFLETLVQRFARLSPRERQVMALVTNGRMNKQVAAELQLSEITVKIHRGAVMKKMQARSLADLVRIANTLGLHE